MSDFEVGEVTTSVHSSPHPQLHCNIATDNIFSY